MKVINKSTLPLGGFAGLKETRLVVDNRIGGNDTTANGVGNFVYLADANFMPLGETHMHPHKEIDVISVMLSGRVRHEGSLEHGKMLNSNDVQAQRAGGEGFVHNEINPDMVENRMLQLWVLPETPNMAANYKSYTLLPNVLTKVYGGDSQQNATLDSKTIIEVALLEQGNTLEKTGEYLAYITGDDGDINGEKVQDGDLIQGENLSLRVNSDRLHITLITVYKS